MSYTVSWAPAMCARFNLNRKFSAPPGTEERRQLASLADRVIYEGSPFHKRNPGDFGLTPPAAPRRGKTLCDRSRIFNQAVASALLRKALMAGMVSERKIGDWPKHIWAVADNGEPLEAQRTRDGVYHGYPLAQNDHFRRTVIHEWTERLKS